MKKLVLLLGVVATSLVLGASFVHAAKPEGKSNNGFNGCERSNENSRACEKNPNALYTCVFLVGGTVFVTHRETDLIAFNPDGWQAGDIAEFDDGSRCLVVEDEPPVGRD